MFGIGMWELMILGIIGAFGLVGVITLVVVVASSNRRRN
jgi:hypothetical protein